MKVLILGGTQFFGRLIVQQLLEDRHRVTVFTRGNRRPEFWDRIEHLAGDRHRPEDLRRELEGRAFDAVIDNQAYDGRDVKMLLRALGARAGHYLLCSSGAVYADGGGTARFRPVREEEADLTRRGDGSYSEGKREAEQATGAAPVPVTVIRPTVVEGPQDPSGRSWYWIQRLADGQPILVPQTDPDTIFAHAWSADVARLFVRAAGSPAAHGRTYNAGGREILTLADYLRTAARLLGREPRLVHAPLEWIRAQPGLEGYDPPFAGERFVMDLQRARQELGYEPTPLSAWLDETLRWHLEGYRGPDSRGYARREAEVAAARRRVAT